MDKKQLIRNLKKQGFPSHILEAFEKTERRRFVPEELEKQAYHDLPLPIGFGQTISQPYTIAFMLTLLDVAPTQKILEIGSGSGYVLELIQHIAPENKIFGIERIKELAESSKEKLKFYKNIKVIYGDGSKGLAKEAPFDRILISASCKDIPHKLIQQLKIKGVLVAPVRDSIVVLKKDSGENKVSEYPGFVFVPLIEDEK